MLGMRRGAISWVLRGWGSSVKKVPKMMFENCWATKANIYLYGIQDLDQDKDLSRQKELSTLPADKGNAAVVWTQPSTHPS